MKKTNSFEELTCEGANKTRGKAFIVIFFCDIVEGWSESFEYETVVVAVVETFDISDDMASIVGVLTVDLFYDGSLRSSGGDVFFNWFYHLTCLKVTFIA